MSIEKGREYLKQFGIEDRVREFTVSSATVELAAQALGVEGARIAKTLSFKSGDGCIPLLVDGPIIRCRRRGHRLSRDGRRRGGRAPPGIGGRSGTGSSSCYSRLHRQRARRSVADRAVDWAVASNRFMGSGALRRGCLLVACSTGESAM